MKTERKNNAPTPPTLSVIMPHFGCERFLHEAVASVLRQTFRRLQLFVVDDASDNDEWLNALGDLLTDERLSLFRTSQRVGPYRIVNRVLERPLGSFIAFHDADDRSDPTRFERQLDCLERTGVDIVGSNFHVIDEAGRRCKSRAMARFPNWWARMGKTFLFLHPSTVIRRRIIDVLGGFDGTTSFGADTDFALRALRLFRGRNIQSFLYDYRVRDDSLCSSSETGHGSQRREEYLQIVRDRERLRRKAKSRQELVQLLRGQPNDVDFQLIPVTRSEQRVWDVQD